VEGRKEQG